MAVASVPACKDMEWLCLKHRECVLIVEVVCLLQVRLQT
jgi:hypothetical protein